MITVRFRETTNWRLQAQITDKLLKNTNNVLEDTAKWIKNDIRSNWTAIAPSSPGEPPAIRTGNLDSSVQVEKQGRDIFGKFTSRENAQTWVVTIDTERGCCPNKRGQYGAVLELLLSRPFLEPAIDRSINFFNRQMKKVL